MNVNSNELPCCDQNTTLNTKQQEVPNKMNCQPAKTTTEVIPQKTFECCEPVNRCERINCCTLSPVTPTPLIPVNPCEKPRCANQDFCCCNTDANECGNFGLTMYGREHALHTGRLVSQYMLCSYKRSE